MSSSVCLNGLAYKKNYMKKILEIEVEKIIKPITTSDGAGVKLKRSIGVDPNYFDPFLMLDEFGSTPILLFNFTPAPSDVVTGFIIFSTSISKILFI